MKLSDRAVLVQLSVSQWTARKYDKRVTQEVADQHGVATSAGRYHKALLPMDNLLAAVSNKATYIRNSLYANTLPWSVEGAQILPTANYLAFMTSFRKEKAEWQALVDTFVDNYESLVQQAKIALGSIYSDADYPSKQAVAGKFKMDLAVFPVPTSDFRCALSNDEIARVQSELEERVKQTQLRATKEVWQRLYDRVQHMVTVLSNPDTRIRDSLIDNTRELCALLSRLNVMNDPAFEAMRQEVEGSLLKLPATLRADPEIRRSTATEAQVIMDKMSTLMGGL